VREDQTRNPWVGSLHHWAKSPRTPVWPGIYRQGQYMGLSSCWCTLQSPSYCVLRLWQTTLLQASHQSTRSLLRGHWQTRRQPGSYLQRRKRKTFFRTKKFQSVIARVLSQIMTYKNINATFWDNLGQGHITLGSVVQNKHVIMFFGLPFTVWSFPAPFFMHTKEMGTIRVSGDSDIITWTTKHFLDGNSPFYT